MGKKPSGPCCSAVGEHEIYCCGSRVRITEKGVDVTTEPLIAYCSLHASLYGTETINREAVRKSVEMKIAGHGFCCKTRVFNDESIVAYGASEMMKVWLEKGLLDCAVVVCEGAGTVVATSGKLVQSIGARLTGIVKTSPIQEIIERVESDGGRILDRSKATIDQVEGVRKAFSLGFSRIAVSVAGFQAKTIESIRELETVDGNRDVLIFSVCNTCVGNDAVKSIAKADIVCASASKVLRTKIGKRALVQLGVTIPVYALTQKAKKLVLVYLESHGQKLVIFRTSNLPYGVEKREPVLRKDSRRLRSHVSKQFMN